jgi:hypothetical protein
MSQAYVMPPVGTDFANQALLTGFPNALEALRSCFSGASEPSAKIAHQLWADTSTGWLKIRNASNSAWVKLCPLLIDFVHQLSVENWFVASLAATRTAKLAICPRAGTVKRLVLFCETASTSSSGNEWQPQVKNYPNSAPGSPVNLFSGTVGTFTALGGVGGGVEFAANKGLVYTPNQNATVADLDLIELVMTKVGTATSLTNFRALIEME